MPVRRKLELRLWSRQFAAIVKMNWMKRGKRSYGSDRSLLPLCYSPLQRRPQAKTRTAATTAQDTDRKKKTRAKASMASPAAPDPLAGEDPLNTYHRLLRDCSPGTPPISDQPFAREHMAQFLARAATLQLATCSVCSEQRFNEGPYPNGECAMCRVGRAAAWRRTCFGPGSQLNPIKALASDHPLHGLTPTEEQLIARISVLIRVHVQSGVVSYGNHTIAFHQDVKEVATQLPRLASELATLVVRKTGKAGKVYDFRVRRAKVRQCVPDAPCVSMLRLTRA
jgi:hypothetical protein